MIHFSCVAASQSSWPSGREERLSRIDSIFKSAEAKGLQTQGVLRYDYFFSDIKKHFLEDFGERLKEDSFEVEGIIPVGKKWQLHIFRNEIHSRQSIDELEKKLRLIKFKYLIDEFDGFSISKADINPVIVPADEFTHFIKSLSDEDLYKASLRLSQLESHDRALVAWEEARLRNLYPDTVAFHFGSSLVGIHEYVKGIESWKEAVKINPSYLEVHLALGKIFYDNSHFKEALSSFLKADALKPDDDMITYHIAETLYQLKRYNESLVSAKRAVKLNRKNIYAKSLLKTLNKPAIKRLRRQSEP